MNLSPPLAQPPPALTSPRAVVHLEYDVANPPSLPGPSTDWTRFVCLSDTHNNEFPVPPGDILLHSGDLTNVGTYGELEAAVKWLGGLPHRQKIIIAGNHDILLHSHDGWYDENYRRWHRHGKQGTRKALHLLQNARQAGVVYLQDSMYKVQAKPCGRWWSIYGFPWSPYHKNWAFNYHRGPEAEELIATIPKTDILLTHAPPSQILDTGRGGGRVGCRALAAHVARLRPQLHVFGHVHEDHSARIHEWSSAPDTTAIREQTVFVNAANKPGGPKATYSDGRRVPFGEGPYCPVIVDMYDPIIEFADSSNP